MSFLSRLWENPVWILLGYLVIVNLVLLCAMGIDKGLAKADKRRVPEATLFLVAIIGGSIGGILGMYLFRHKTRHMSFVIGFPVILILQAALAMFIIVRL